MNSFSLRKTLVLPVALTLALGGALLAASPAHADPSFSVTSPTEGQTVGTSTPSDIVDATGAGIEGGDTLSVSYSDDNDDQHTATVTDLVGPGTLTWSATVAFPDLSPGQTSVRATFAEVDGDTPVLTQTVDFQFATAPSPALVPTVATGASILLTDATGAGIPVDVSNFYDDENLTIGVTGPSGAVALPNDETTGRTDGDGSYTGVAILPTSAAGGVYTVTVTGAQLAPTVQQRRPDPQISATSTISVLADPVITSPAAGHTVTGTTTAVSGTGTPGAEVIVIGGLTRDIQGLTTQVKHQLSKATSLKAAGRASAPDSDPVIETTPVVVGSNGQWSISVPLTPNDYTIAAISAFVDQDGDALTDINSAGVVSESTTETEFVVAAATVVTPPMTTGTTTTATGTGTTTTLAYTGSTPLPFTIAAGLLLLIGSGLVLVARRRSKLAI